MGIKPLLAFFIVFYIPRISANALKREYYKVLDEGMNITGEMVKELNSSYLQCGQR